MKTTEPINQELKNISHGPDFAHSYIHHCAVLVHINIHWMDKVRDTAYSAEGWFGAADEKDWHRIPYSVCGPCQIGKLAVG